MTVNNQTSKIVYVGDNSTTSWSFSFPGVDPLDIYLFLTPASGIVIQVPVGQYNVTLNPTIDPNPTSIGGTVIYPLTGPPLDPSVTLTIVRILPDVQTTSIAPQSIIYPPVIEQALDYLTLIDQQLMDATNRAVKVGIADQPMATLPPLAMRINQQAVFDANGNLVAGGLVTGTVISPVMVPVVTAPTLGQAQTAMGVAPIASPVFTGNPTAPTPPVNDNSQSVATTAFVESQLSTFGVSFPSGSRMLFQQSTPPVGWVTDTTHNDKALRIVNGTVGSGGSVGFSTVFGRAATDGFTLTTNEMPYHTHGVRDPGHAHSVADPQHFHYAAASNDFVMTSDGNTYYVTTTTTNLPLVRGTTAIGNTENALTGIGIYGNYTGVSTLGSGSSASHSHGMNIQVLYVDFIIAVKS